MTPVTIIGGGIAGLTTAIALQKIGINSIIFEAAPSIRALGAGLGLAANAIKAFDKLGILEEVIPLGRLLPAFMIYDQSGKIITKTDSQLLAKKYGTDNFTIHRADLHQLLHSKISHNRIFLNKKAVDLQQKGKIVKILFEDGSTHETQSLIIADGIHSPLRKKLLPNSMPRYAGYTCWRAVINNAELNLTETSETWGTAGRFGIVPLANNQVYWFACVTAPQNSQKMKNFQVADLQHLFQDFHQPIPQILEQTKNDDLIWNDIIDLEPIQQYAFGNVVLIGDAAHATTPNMGQGACQAIEDAVILANELSKNQDFAVAFQQFEKRRLKRTHEIVNTSWKVGKVAQLGNPLLASLRNFVFRLLPPSINEKQLKMLYEVDF